MSPVVVVLWAVALAPPAPFREVHRDGGLVVSARAHAGSAVNEVRAVSVVDEDADVLWALVRDVEGHTALLPDTTVSEIVGAEVDDAGDVVFVRQRCETPLLDPREYVIATRTHDVTRADGRRQRTLSWRATQRFADALSEDAVHVDVNEGAIVVADLGGGRSELTFQIRIDPAGAVPAFIVNLAQGAGVQEALVRLRHAAHSVRRAPRAPPPR